MYVHITAMQNALVTSRQFHQSAFPKVYHEILLTTLSSILHFSRIGAFWSNLSVKINSNGQVLGNSGH